MNAIVMAILKNPFPYRPPPGARVRSLEDLRAEYQLIEFLASACGRPIQKIQLIDDFRR